MPVLSPASMQQGGAVLSPAAVGGRRRTRKGKVTKKARKMMRTLAKMTGRKIKMMGGEGGEGEGEETKEDEAVAVVPPPASAGSRRRSRRLRSRRPRSLFF
jgi:hypothetical protein